MHRRSLYDSVGQSSHRGWVRMQTSRWIEIAADVRTSRLARGRFCKCLRVAANPGRLLSVCIGPRIVQHADFQAGDVTLCCFVLEICDQSLHIAIGPRIVAPSLSYHRPGKPGFRLLLPFPGGPGQLSPLIDPSTLTGSGGQRNSLLKIAGPFHHRANRPADVQNHATVTADAREERLKPVPEFVSGLRQRPLLEPIEVNLNPSVRVDRNFRNLLCRTWALEDAEEYPQ